MPTPIDILLDPVTLVSFAIYVALILWEHAFPARRLPVVPWWRTGGILAFMFYFLLASYLPLAWGELLANVQVFDFATTPVWLQVAGGLLAYEFGLYWWHRTMHGSDTLWRLFHQFHHSAERHDTFGAFWFSPLDILGFTLLGSLVLTFVGVGAEASVLILYITVFLAALQHANVRTPLWLGYLVQRPESHSQHHRRGQHRYNYADLPVFDLMFGTFRNPAEHFDVGFYPGASRQLASMWLGRDVNAPDMRRGMESA